MALAILYAFVAKSDAKLRLVFSNIRIFPFCHILLSMLAISSALCKSQAIDRALFEQMEGKGNGLAHKARPIITIMD